MEAQDRGRSARWLRTDRDADDGAELPRHARQAGLDGTPTAGGRGSGARRAWLPSHPRCPRPARHPGAEPAAHARLLERPRADRGAVHHDRGQLVVRYRRHRGHRRRRLPLLLRPRRQTSSDRPATASGRRRWRTRSSNTPRCRSPRSSGCRTLRGQVVAAFVIAAQGFEPGEALAAELQEHAKRITAPYKYPRRIEFVESLPKTVSGRFSEAPCGGRARRTGFRRPGTDRSCESGRPAVSSAPASTRPTASSYATVQSRHGSHQTFMGPLRAAPKA